MTRSREGPVVGEAPVLRIAGLVKSFPRRGKPPVMAVQGVNLALQAGELVGLLGPNGAGKTSIIKCALGLIRPSAGDVAICGHDVRTRHGQAIEHASAVLEGARNVYWRLTAKENIRFFTGIHGLPYRANRDYCEHLLERFGLARRANEPLINLSTGMKQKVAVVAALAKRTQLVFLDEPTLGLDVETSLELRGILRELAAEGQRAIVVSSHDMDVIQDVCRRVIILKEGRVVADDTVDNLLSLFRTRSYHLVLRDGLTPELAGRLAGVASNLSLERRGAQTELSFTLPAAERLYEVIDIVRQGGAVIETIAQKEPDLEEAFLQVIKGGDAA
jgi:ABC-2 type transport system ATP-binding protein